MTQFKRVVHEFMGKSFVDITDDFGNTTTIVADFAIEYPQGLGVKSAWQFYLRDKTVESIMMTGANSDNLETGDYVEKYSVEVANCESISTWVLRRLKFSPSRMPAIPQCECEAPIWFLNNPNHDGVCRWCLTFFEGDGRPVNG